jgi:hypothetical protein
VAALWVLLLAPLFLLAAISLRQPLYIVGRYDQLALPAFPLLAGVALARLGSLRRWGRPVSVLAAGALLVPVVVVLAHYYRTPPSTNANTRRAAAALGTRVHDGDVVLLSHPRSLPLLYQLGRLGYRVRAGSCERPTSEGRFACWQYPRPLGLVLTGEDVARIKGRADVVGEDLDALYLPALGGSERDVFLVLGAYGKGANGPMVSPEDRLSSRRSPPAASCLWRSTTSWGSSRSAAPGEIAAEGCGVSPRAAAPMIVCRVEYRRAAASTSRSRAWVSRSSGAELRRQGLEYLVLGT